MAGAVKVEDNIRIAFISDTKGLLYAKDDKNIWKHRSTVLVKSGRFS